MDITPSAAPSASTAIGIAAPVITGTQVTRTANSITIGVTGYSMALSKPGIGPGGAVVCALAGGIQRIPTGVDKVLRVAGRQAPIPLPDVRSSCR